LLRFGAADGDAAGPAEVKRGVAGNDAASQVRIARDFFKNTDLTIGRELESGLVVQFQTPAAFGNTFGF
jgi:hypothetical protein